MDNKENKPKQKKPLNLYVRFTGVAFQMIAIICVFSFLGVWLDKKFPNNFTAFTIIFSLIGVISSMYIVIKQVLTMIKDNK